MCDAQGLPMWPPKYPVTIECANCGGVIAGTIFDVRMFGSDVFVENLPIQLAPNAYEFRQYCCGVCEIQFDVTITQQGGAKYYAPNRQGFDGFLIASNTANGWLAHWQVAR